jgi:ATP-dependent helicase/nuclease subunit B
MKVLAHPDPWRLETELGRQVTSAQGTDPLARVLVLVPTVRLARHARRRLAADRAALLGVEVLHHRALTYRLLDLAGSPAPQLLSPTLQDCILGEALERAPRDPLSIQARTYSGARRRLLSTFRELREAMVTPADLTTHSQPGNETLVETPALLYGHYVDILVELQEQDQVDEALLVERAVEAARATDLPWSMLIHHGAGDLIGIHLDLLRACAAGRACAYLLPAAPGCPAWKTAEEFARTQLLDKGEEIETLADEQGGLLGARLAHLYDEDATSEPALPEGMVTLRHAQGGTAEIQAAQREILAAVADGTPPGEIMIVARRLDGGETPYGLLWEQAAGGEHWPFSSSLTVPLRRDPAVRDFLRLLHANEDDFPRPAMAGLAGSPHLNWAALISEGDIPTPHQIDLWSLRGGLLGGLEEWLNLLPPATSHGKWNHDDDPESRQEATDRADRERLQATSFGEALSALRQRLPQKEMAWSEHARAIRELWRDLMVAQDETPESSGLAGVLADMALRRIIPGGKRKVSGREMLSWFDQVVDGTLVPTGMDQEGGIKVLDAMQARGLTARRVIMLGLQSGSFPHPTSEDPFLPDSMRHRVRAGTGTPLAVTDDDDEEDSLLFGLMVGAARDHLSISWQRADESGRARMPGLAMREIGRLAFGSLDLQRLATEQATALPSNPERLLAGSVRRGELMSPRDTQLLLALSRETSTEAKEHLDRLRPDLADGLALLDATDRFSGPGTIYDGALGEGARRRPIHSASSLELLGRCPLQYFFTYCLGLRDEESEPELLQLSPREMGSRVHALLENFYSQLMAAGSFAPDSSPLTSQEIRSQLQTFWSQGMEDLLGPRRSRLPGLWQGVERTWLDSLERFIHTDLNRLRNSGFQPVSLEEEKSSTLSLLDDRQARFRSFFDRRLESSTGHRLSDYKTGGKPAEQVKITAMLRAERLQAPLYRLVAGDEPAVEILGVGPAFQAHAGPVIPGSPPLPSEGTFEGFENQEQEIGFQETLGMLLDLAEGDRFPLNRDVHCSWCAFRRACRRNHPPTCAREESTDDSQDYRESLKKTAKKPRLASSQGSAGSGS